MLRITPLTAQASRYYVADLAVELDVVASGSGDRTAAGREPSGQDLPGAQRAARAASAGRWHGSVAEGLGLCGPVMPAALDAVLSGAHPASGRSLKARPSAVRGFDLTFSAPKSASVLFGLSDPGRAAAVLDAHRSAVDGALSYVDARAISVRRGTGDDRHVERARGAVAALFTHGVSRALDPHLHTHVIVPNLAHGLDGRWTALDGRGLFAHAQAAGALYDAELRYGLASRLGVTWARRRPGAYELDAVDPVVIGALSQRSAEIREHLHERAPARAASIAPSRRARTVAWAVTRDPKPAVPTPDALRAGWERRARDAGWSGCLERELSRRRGPAPRGDVIDEHGFAAALAVSASGAVTRRDVVAAWASALGSGAPARVVDECVDALATWDGVAGVAEKRSPCHTVVPQPHLLRALGARPSAPDALTRWLVGAAAIERYRHRWLPGGSREPLGVQGTMSELSVLPARRLAEHVALTRELSEIQRQLGVDTGRDARRAPGGIERSLGLG